MRDLIQVICENLDRTIEVEMGTSLLDIQRQYLPKGPHPYLAAYVNNRIKELNYKVYTPITVRYIDATHFEGIRVYERTASFILQRAVRDRLQVAVQALHSAEVRQGAPDELAVRVGGKRHSLLVHSRLLVVG